MLRVREMRQRLLRTKTAAGHLQQLWDNPAAQVLDLGAPVARVQGKGYAFCMRSDVPVLDVPVQVFFPCLPPEERVLVFQGSTRSLLKLQELLNDRLRRSPREDDGGASVGVYFGDTMYRCKGIKGSLYLYWASFVTVSFHGAADVVRENVPTLLVTRGNGKVRSVAYLWAKSAIRVPIECGVEWQWPVALHFVCDTRPGEVEETRPNHILTEKEAKAETLRPRNAPMHVHDSAYTDYGGDIDSIEELQDQMERIRGGVFLQPTNVEAASPVSTPGRSDDLSSLSEDEE